MQRWAVQDAKARFSEFLDNCVNQGPQLVTKRGVEAAVLIPIEVWHKLQENTKPSLKQLLLTDNGRYDDLVIPKRGNAQRRKIEEIR